MQYYPGVKRNELFICTKTGVNLKSIMLSAISHTKGYIMDDSICMIFWKRPTYSHQNSISGCQRPGVGRRIDYKEAEGKLLEEKEAMLTTIPPMFPMPSF